MMSRRLEDGKAGRKVKTPILGDELVTSFCFLYRTEAAHIGLAGQRRICYPCPAYDELSEADLRSASQTPFLRGLP